MALEAIHPRRSMIRVPRIARVRPDHQEAPGDVHRGQDMFCCQREYATIEDIYGFCSRFHHHRQRLFAAVFQKCFRRTVTSQENAPHVCYDNGQMALNGNRMPKEGLVRVAGDFFLDFSFRRPCGSAVYTSSETNTEFMLPVVIRQAGPLIGISCGQRTAEFLHRPIRERQL